MKLNNKINQLISQSILTINHRYIYTEKCELLYVSTYVLMYASIYLSIYLCNALISFNYEWDILHLVNLQN